jgi:hypothetical protein
VSGDPRIKCARDAVDDKVFWPRSLYDKVYPSFTSGESGVRPPPGGTLGRAVNLYGLLLLPEAGFGRDGITTLDRQGF